MSDRKLLILANPFAGKGKTKKVLQLLIQFLDSHQIRYEIADSTNETNATDTLSKNLNDTFSDVIVLGGDGTLNEVINGLSVDIPVSIIPCGTGNDFIKNVFIGEKLKDQLQTAVFGEIKKVDLGICNGRKFHNGIGIGFDGQIVQDMVHKRVPLLSGHAAYYYHVLRILGSYRPRTFEYELDDTFVSKNLIILTIGNGTTFGGGFKLMPNAKVDDSILDVCAIGDLSPLRRFLNIHRLSNGTHGNLKEVSFQQTKKLVVHENPMLYAHMDGERIGQPPFEIEILPKALQLRVSTS